MATSDPHGDAEAQQGIEMRGIVDGVNESKDEIVERQPRGQTKTQGSAENYGDPSGKLWTMYLTEARKEDDQKTKNWSEDTSGVLVFTGLFSAVVTTFIMESYKKLSPDSGNQTVALLTQLVNITTGTPVQSSPPFQVPASIIRVNIMWFLSLILSLSCALLATLMQQWARRYLEYAQHRGAPRKQARIRAYMFDGVESFGLAQAVEAMPLLLHSSVFLFFAGLIDYLLPINETVAFTALGAVVVFAFIYMILTFLPTLRLNCPYRTPLSAVTYYSYQFSAFNIFSTAKAIEGTFHGLLLKLWRRLHPHARGSANDGPTKWREVLETRAHAHYKWLLHGIRRRVEVSAMDASSRVDASALHWTLTTLDEDVEIEDFADRMPGFFDSRSGPDATWAMLSLMSSEQPASDPILGSRLRDLLKTCLPGTSGLSEKQRENRLRVCLKSLWCCLRAYNQPEYVEVPLPSYIRSVLASPEVIGWIQTEEDPATRLLGRCFGSLVVKKLVNGITASARTSITAITAELACLSYNLGKGSDQVYEWLINYDSAIDLANVISLTSSEINSLIAPGGIAVPSDVLHIFVQTLGILVEGVFPKHVDSEYQPDDLPPELVAQFHDICSKFSEAWVPDSLKEKLRHISDKLPPRSSYAVEEATITFPTPQLESVTTPSPGVLRIEPMRIEGAPDSGFVEGNECSTPARD